MPTQTPEPRAPKELLPFEARDLESLAPARARDKQYDEWRLVARRKLAVIAKRAVAGAKALGEEGVELDSRTSLHHPHAFNGNRVQRLWAYITRSKKAKTRLRRTLGSDLAKDLDSAYRNLYLCVALEHDALEVSLRIHADAWYDGQNATRRLAKEGVRGWMALLNELDGYQLRLADWKGEWPCGKLTPEQVEEYLRFYTPGEHALAIERRWPVPTDPGAVAAREATFSEEVPQILVDELVRLVPLYRYMAWSDESDHLFGG